MAFRKHLSSFRDFFDKLAELIAQGASADAIGALAARYGHYYDLEKTRPLIEKHGLLFAMP